MNIPFIRERASDHAQAMIARFLGLSLDTAGRLSDFNEGSNTRNIFEAVGLRLENLDNKVFSALRRAIPTVLYEFLGPGDGVTTSVGFPLLPALPATGLVRFTKSGNPATPVTIPAGFRVAVPNTVTAAEKVYALVASLTIPANQTLADGLVRSSVLGKIGNTPAGTISLKDTLSGVESATNPAAFLSGAEIETDEARRQRFVQYLRNLARSQYAGLEFGASIAQVMSAGVVVEKVLFARSFDVPDKRGLVSLYVDNGAGTASEDLVAAAQEIIDGTLTTSGARVAGYKTAGVVVNVTAVTPQAVPVTIKIKPAPGYLFADRRSAVQLALENTIFGVGAFTDLVIAKLEVAAMGVLGVADAVLVSPAANVLATTGARVLPGVMTINAL